MAPKDEFMSQGEGKLVIMMLQDQGRSIDKIFAKLDGLQCGSMNQKIKHLEEAIRALEDAPEKSSTKFLGWVGMVTGIAAVVISYWKP